MDKILITTIQFSNTLPFSMVPHFRGAIINSLEHDNILFHNHLGQNYRYSYPIIQYKIIGNKAAIICLGQGNDAIEEYFSSYTSNINLGGHPVSLHLESVKKEYADVGICSKTDRYRMTNWLPLNKENFIKYTSMESMQERCSLLEKILIGNILSFSKGIGLSVKEEIKCTLCDIPRHYMSIYKGVRLMGFDIVFDINFIIPSNIGLGKGVSIGNGIVSPTVEA